MGLEADYTGIHNYSEVCWVIDRPYDEKHDGALDSWGKGRIRDVDGVPHLTRLNPLVEALVWNSISIGMGKITVDNASEYYARCKIMEKIHGPLVTYGDGTHLDLTPAHIEELIGLRVNVSYETRKEWAMRIFVGHGDYWLRHYGEKRKSDAQIQEKLASFDTTDTSKCIEFVRQFDKARREANDKLAVELGLDQVTEGIAS
jgi:hypothetical protein